MRQFKRAATGVRGVRGVLVLALGALAGCVQSPDQAQWVVRSTPSTLAQSCKIATANQYYELNAGRSTLMRVSNDGSCAFSLFRLPRGGNSDVGGQPFDSARILERPQHGEVSFIRTETATWVEYSPVGGYVGSDRFAFQLAPGYGQYPTEVTVIAPTEAVKVPPRLPPDLSVYFDFDSAQLTADARAMLDRLSPLVADPGYAAWRIDVSGHTDGSGTEGYNDRLAERRAIAVRDYLAVRAGMDPRRLNVSAYGKTMLADPQHPLDGANRRVHITLVPASLATVRAKP